MVDLSPAYDPVLMIGMKLYPEDPFRFDFIFDQGSTPEIDRQSTSGVDAVATRLIKYFFAALTVPEKDLWVNLSPYEKDRIIPQGIGQTELGRDLLAQDYLLKQLTASLMYPEKELGRAFWKRVKDKTREKYGTNEIPMETFHKVWIVPDRASVYVSGTSVFVTGSHHKVMLENDYLALEANLGHTRHGLGDARPEDLTPLSDIAKEIIREIIIPEIEREVNTGKSFAHLRQISNAVILATWYKRHVAGSVLQDIYTDHNRTAGVDTQDKQINQKIYQQYLKAFQQGVYNFIKEDYDEGSRTMIPRKYFSGGVVEKYGQIDESQTPDGIVKKVAGATRIAVQASVTVHNQELNEIIPAPREAHSEESLEKYMGSIGKHAFLPMFREIFSSTAEFPDVPNMNYAELGEKYTHVHTDSGGNTWGYIPVHLNEAGQSFFGTFSRTEKPVANQQAFLIIFNPKEGNYNGKFDALHNLPMALVVEDPIQDKNILFDITFLWSYPARTDWILKNAQDVINEKKLSTFKDWSGLMLMPEETEYVNAPPNGEGQDKGYSLSLLTVKPYREQKTAAAKFLQEDPLDALPHEKIFSVRHDASTDFREALGKNARIFKDKTVRVQGPGIGVDVLLALLFGANKVTYYDINPAHNLLTAWNVRYARVTGLIPESGETIQTRDMGDADVYLFNTPAVYDEQFLWGYLSRRKGISYTSRAYFMTPKEFIVLFNELKEKLTQNKNSQALWRIMVDPDSGFIDDVPDASYEMRVKEFLKKNNLVGDPVEGALHIANDAAFHPNLYLFHAAKEDIVRCIDYVK